MGVYLLFSTSTFYGARRDIVCDAETGHIYEPNCTSPRRIRAGPKDICTGPHDKIVFFGEKSQNAQTSRTVLRSERDIEEQMNTLSLTPQERGRVAEAFRKKFKIELRLKGGFNTVTPEKHRIKEPPSAPDKQAAAPPPPAAESRPSLKKQRWASPGALTDYFRDLRAGTVDYDGLPRNPGDDKWWERPMRRRP